MNAPDALRAVQPPTVRTDRALGVAIMAMGGEGGGVLADWIVDLAEHAGYTAQATSVPGVAQRTGSTIYYVEMLAPDPRAGADMPEPVLALMPVPGDVDVVIASELMEAGRAVQRGLVTPTRTTLVASSHRTYSMTERTALGDGRVDADRLREGAALAACRFVCDDFARLAEEAGSVVSAALFGALTGSAALPFSRAEFEDAIRRGGVGVDASLAAFARGYEAAARDGSRDTDGAASPVPTATAAVAAATASPLPAQAPLDPPAQASEDAGARLARQAGAAPVALGPALSSVATRIESEFPVPVHGTLRHVVLRLADWQDVRHADEMLSRLAAVRDVDGRRGDGSWRLLDETARHLGLWASYEDAVRVADLKTRSGRFERVRQEARRGESQLLAISEYMHPRVEEIADILPAALGRRLLDGPRTRALAGRVFSRGRTVRTTSLSGFLQLSLVAAMRPLRRRSLRWQVEFARIDAWLAQVVATAESDWPLAVELAACQQLVKGYGETHVRGWTNFQAVTGALPRLQGRPDAAARLRALRDAALADEHGHALRAALTALDATASARVVGHRQDQR